MNACLSPLSLLPFSSSAAAMTRPRKEVAVVMCLQLEIVDGFGSLSNVSGVLGIIFE